MLSRGSDTHVKRRTSHQQRVSRHTYQPRQLVECNGAVRPTTQNSGAVNWLSGIESADLCWLPNPGSGSLRHRGHGRLKAGWKAGREGGKNFAIFGAVYSLALCYAKKFRKTEDPINSAIAGCCTGLALGWKGGPTAALQNCLTLGAFSWVLESINPAPANAAVPITGDGSPCFQKQGDGVYLQSVLTLACPQPLGWCFRNAPGCSLDMVKG
uniref:Mitochondrial import inner membrane translocase subunit TIM22 n=1 Tax=Picocystis salinarum TaxID=88271 RepID=A0A7S3U9A0_9CHLO|mmetsp:Transcript_932/g.5856  ORF Transcript_932/g.5856 Transcript_932/m.5856 type:complete len:212 (-) Transcript_932:1104-1739(-)